MPAQNSQENPTPHMDAVTTLFIMEVQQKGLTHVLNWMDDWYLKEAEASIHDEVLQAMNNRMAYIGEGGRWDTLFNRQQASHALMRLVATRHLLSIDPSRQSSQAGSTQRNRCLAAAALKLLNQADSSFCSRTTEDLQEQVNSLFKNHYQPPKAPKPTTLRVTEGLSAAKPAPSAQSTDNTSTNTLLMSSTMPHSADTGTSHDCSSSSSDSGSSSSDCSGGGGD